MLIFMSGLKGKEIWMKYYNFNYALYVYVNDNSIFDFFPLQYSFVLVLVEISVWATKIDFIRKAYYKSAFALQRQCLYEIRYSAILKYDLCVCKYPFVILSPE